MTICLSGIHGTYVQDIIDISNNVVHIKVHCTDIEIKADESVESGSNIQRYMYIALYYYWSTQLKNRFSHFLYQSPVNHSKISFQISIFLWYLMIYMYILLLKYGLRKGLINCNIWVYIWYIVLTIVSNCWHFLMYNVMEYFNSWAKDNNG